MVQNFESFIVDLSVKCKKLCSYAKGVKETRHSLLQTYLIFRGLILYLIMLIVIYKVLH